MSSDHYEEHDIYEEDSLRDELPFNPQSGSWVDWVYDHRRGLLVTVVVYLLLAIGIVTARISHRPTDSGQSFFVDLSELDKLIEEKERLEQLVQDLQLQQLEQEYYESIRNLASNADGELNSALRDAQGTEASNIYNEAQALEERMQAARNAYEQGLQEADNILNNRPQTSSGDNPGATARVEGAVSISYSLPGRHATYLYRPTYQCQGGGEITVNIVVNRNGQVIDASVASGSSADNCLREFAVRAARASTFNVDGTADNRQSGTITYAFVPQ